MNHKHDTDTRVTPCLQHPGDWFDPKRRTFTRQQCLQCPAAQRLRPIRSPTNPPTACGPASGSTTTSPANSIYFWPRPPSPPNTTLRARSHTPPPVSRARRPRGTRRIRVGRLLTLPHHRPSPHTSPPAPAVTAKSWPPPAPTNRPPSSPAARAQRHRPRPGQPRRRHRRLP